MSTKNKYLWFMKMKVFLVFLSCCFNVSYRSMHVCYLFMFFFNKFYINFVLYISKYNEYLLVIFPWPMLARGFVSGWYRSLGLITGPIWKMSCFHLSYLVFIVIFVLIMFDIYFKHRNWHSVRANNNNNVHLTWSHSENIFAYCCRLTRLSYAYVCTKYNMSNLIYSNLVFRCKAT
jgi:hypothetical protein